MPQVPSKPSCFKTMVAFKCCRLPTYSPKMPQVPSNSSISSPPWLLLSAVGCQPTAPKCLKFPPNPGVSRPWLLLKCINKPSCFKTMVAFKCCRLPTYSPKMPQVPSKPSCFKTMVAFKCCRLPTYSPKMPIKASSSLQTLVFQDHGCF